MLRCNILIHARPARIEWKATSAPLKAKWEDCKLGCGLTRFKLLGCACRVHPR